MPNPWRKTWSRLWLLTVWKTKVAADQARDSRDWRLAADLYEKVLRRSRHLDGIRVQLGHMYKEMGEFDLAARQYHDVLARTPQDDDLHLQIGHLEKLSRHWTAAVRHYGEAVRINPANSDALGEYQALGGALTLDMASRGERRASAPPALRGAAAGGSGANDWPPPDAATLPPLPPDVREIYAMITLRPAGF